MMLSVFSVSLEWSAVDSALLSSKAGLEWVSGKIRLVWRIFLLPKQKVAMASMAIFSLFHFPCRVMLGGFLSV